MVGRTLAPAVALAASPAFGRATEHLFPAREAAESEHGQKDLLAVPFYRKGESHPAVKGTVVGFGSERSTSGAFRGGRVALAGIAALSRRARAEARAQLR